MSDPNAQVKKRQLMLIGGTVTVILLLGAGGMFFDWLGRARSSLDLGVRAFIEQDSTSVLDFLNPARVLGPALIYRCYWRTVPVYITAQYAGGEGSRVRTRYAARRLLCGRQSRRRLRGDRL